MDEFLRKTTKEQAAAKKARSAPKKKDAKAPAKKAAAAAPKEKPERIELPNELLDIVDQINIKEEANFKPNWARIRILKVKHSTNDREANQSLNDPKIFQNESSDWKAELLKEWTARKEDPSARAPTLTKPIPKKQKRQATAMETSASTEPPKAKRATSTTTAGAGGRDPTAANAGENTGNAPNDPEPVENQPEAAKAVHKLWKVYATVHIGEDASVATEFVEDDLEYMDSIFVTDTVKIIRRQRGYPPPYPNRTRNRKRRVLCQIWRFQTKMTILPSSRWTKSSGTPSCASTSATARGRSSASTPRRPTRRWSSSGGAATGTEPTSSRRRRSQGPAHCPRGSRTAGVSAYTTFGMKRKKERKKYCNHFFLPPVFRCPTPSRG